MGHTDAAKRVSDATMLAWVAHGWDSVGQWMAFALADGTTDHVVYPAKRDAVRHMPNEFNFMYAKLQPAGMPVCAAEIMLRFTRQAHDAGFRLADPDAKDGGKDLIPRIGTAEVNQQIRYLKH
jgi:hypothetical protein